jgi:serine phosphatase RsbU (regulator of sigma subunit)
VTIDLRAFEQRYASALRGYLESPDETHLSEAYELGRQAVSDQLSMLELAAAHHSVLVSALEGPDRPAPVGQLAARAGAFFVESLSTYEMTQRGFAEAQAAAREERERYEREHEIAVTLQRSLLPESLPPIPGVRIAARYRPAGEGNEVGGDFYDAFPAGEDRWIVVLGDVCGKGARAAALTALARYTIRATARHERQPSRILAALNDAMLSQVSSSEFVTVCCANLSANGEGASLDLACGGHPLPLLRTADRRIQQVGAHGTAIGAYDDPRLSDHRVDLGAGDCVLFFTDGVTDAAAPGAAWSASGLAEFFAGLSADDPSDIVEEIELAVVAQSSGIPRDDLALLAVQFTGAEER